MKKSVFVTGAGGYIGKLVIEALAKDTECITTLVAHDINELPENKKIAGVQYVQGDIRSENISEFLLFI